MRRIIKSIFIASLLMELLLTNNLCHVFADYTFECVQEIRNIGAESGYILSTPTSIDKDNNGNYYIADLANNRVLKLDRNMNKVAQIDDLDMPITVYIDNQGNILICELGTHKIVKYAPNFLRITDWGGKGEAYGRLADRRAHV